MGTDPNTGEPAGEIAKAVRSKCVDSNLLILSCGTYENVVRWIPPLAVTEEQIDEAVDVFERAVKDAVADHSACGDDDEEEGEVPAEKKNIPKNEIRESWRQQHLINTSYFRAVLQ